MMGDSFLRNLLDDQPQWQELARCSETDPEVFFPEKGGSPDHAKRICRRCEVRSDCMQYALEHQERWGVWGGLTERDRRRILRRRVA